VQKSTSVNKLNFVPCSVLTDHIAQALIRDDWRCVVTGFLDLRAPQAESGINTQCAHIIPEATFFGVEPKCEENTKVCGCARLVLC
jgi:hypothetical protein